MMPSNVAIYRLPSVVFPVRFRMSGSEWQLRTFELHGCGVWACHLEGPSRWMVNTAATQGRLERELRTTGVEIPQHTFVGAVFRHLVKLSLAEEVHRETPGTTRRK